MRRQVIRNCTAVLGCGIVLCAGQVRGDDDTNRLQRLEDAVQQLQLQNQELQKELTEVKGPPAATPVQSTNTSFWATYVVPGAKDSKVVLGGYFQGNAEFGDVNAYDGAFPDSGPISKRTDDRFRIRRARIGVWGDLTKYFDFKLMGDFTQGDGINSGNGGSRNAFSATDLFINYHQFPEMNVKFGQYDTPYGMEQFSIPDMYTLTAERSAVTEALRVERQIGVTLWGKPLANLWSEQKDLVSYWFGVYNGNNRNVSGNDNQDFMYMARLEVQPFKGQLFGQPTSWKVGIDGYISKDATNTVLTQTGNLLVATDGRLSTLSVQTKDAHRTAAGVDQRFECGPFTLQAEYLQTRYQDAVAAVPDFTSNGYWALGAYQIIPNRVELVCKYEWLHPDQKESDDLRTITGGINWYIKGRETRDIVLMLDYMHTWSHYREVNPGYGPDSFDELLTRVEFNF